MSANFSSISPVDGKIVWEAQQSQPAAVDAAMTRASAAAKSWRKVSGSDRIAIVRNYRQQLESNRSEIEQLIVREVGKLPWDATAEVNASIAKIELSIDAQQQRRSARQLESIPPNSPVRRRIDFQPLGVVLVLGPFNFPVHLPGGQIVPALLSGNSVIFKPSELAAGIGRWMVNAWLAAGLPNDVLQPLYGGPEVAARAIDSPHTSAVFLTGSRAAGRAIHRQLAGRPDVLLALELGGNNPIVIASDAPADLVGPVVSASAFISSGQRCTCARRAIFIQSESADLQIACLIDKTSSLRTGLPGDSAVPEIGPLISEQAASELKLTYDKLIDLGCRPIIPWQTDSRAGHLVRPTILDGSKLSQSQQTELGELEWFGPLLVIERADDFDHAIELAANTPYGLAAALLGGTQPMFERFAAEVGAGVVNWNGTTTGAAGTLPFGGLGDSGNHRPAGFYAIDFCSDPVAILDRSKLSDDDPWSVAR